MQPATFAAARAGCPGPGQACSLCTDCALHGAPGVQIVPRFSSRFRQGATMLRCEDRVSIHPHTPAQPAAIHKDGKQAKKPGGVDKHACIVSPGLMDRPSPHIGGVAVTVGERLAAKRPK